MNGSWLKFHITSLTIVPSCKHLVPALHCQGFLGLCHLDFNLNILGREEEGHRYQLSSSPFFLPSLMLQKKTQLDCKVLTGKIEVSREFGKWIPKGCDVGVNISVRYDNNCRGWQILPRGGEERRWRSKLMRVNINNPRSCLDVECGPKIGSLSSASKPLCCFMEAICLQPFNNQTHHSV